MTMEITKAADYGLRAMYRLGQTPRDQSALIGVIAEEMSIPAQFLHKVMPRLVKAGLVRSRRGARGGYRLAMDPAEISLLNIIEAIDGPVFINRCLVDKDDCALHLECAIRPVFARAQAALRKVLQDQSLADVLKGKAQHASLASAPEGTPPRETTSTEA